MKYKRKTVKGHTRAVREREGFSEAYVNGECLGTYGDFNSAYRAIQAHIAALPKKRSVLK